MPKTKLLNCSIFEKNIYKYIPKKINFSQNRKYLNSKIQLQSNKQLLYIFKIK